MVGLDHAMRLFLTAAESVEMSAHKRSNPEQKQAVLKRKQALEQKGWLLDRANTIFNAEAREAVSGAKAARGETAENRPTA